MEYFGGIDPMSNPSTFAALRTVNRGNASDQFTSIFLAEMMKQALGSQGGMFQAEEGNDLFPGISGISDVFVEKFAAELAKSGKLNDLMSKKMPSGNALPMNEMNGVW